MKLKLTDGNSTAEFTFAEDIDFKDCEKIRRASRPITTALKIIKERYGDLGMYPIPQNALTGV